MSTVTVASVDGSATFPDEGSQLSMTKQGSESEELAPVHAKSDKQEQVGAPITTAATGDIGGAQVADGDSDSDNEDLLFTGGQTRAPLISQLAGAKEKEKRDREARKREEERRKAEEERKRAEEERRAKADSVKQPLEEDDDDEDETPLWTGGQPRAPLKSQIEGDKRKREEEKRKEEERKRMEKEKKDKEEADRRKKAGRT